MEIAESKKNGREKKQAKCAGLQINYYCSLCGRRIEKKRKRSPYCDEDCSKLARFIAMRLYGLQTNRYKRPVLSRWTFPIKPAAQFKRFYLRCAKKFHPDISDLNPQVMTILNIVKENIERKEAERLFKIRLEDAVIL